MKQHGQNAMYVANELKKAGLKVRYPGLPDHPQHELLNGLMNSGYGYGGMITLELESVNIANNLMRMMQLEKVGYLAVSLGYFKTLFSCSGKSTSSEVPDDVQKEMGLCEGLIRFSIGLDNDIERSVILMKKCMHRLKIL